MDIIVTTPKSEHKTAEAEAEAVANDPNSFWFRTIRGKPNVQIGDRVYYVDNGMIRGYGVVFEIEVGEMWDDTHERWWNGTNLKQRIWVWLKKPIPFRGFQGFRYINKIDGLKEKLEQAS